MFYSSKSRHCYFEKLTVVVVLVESNKVGEVDGMWSRLLISLGNDKA